MTDPLLIDVPECIVTERLILRCPKPGDGTALNAAVCESLEQLRPYVPWAGTVPTIAESEAIVRKAQARFLLREGVLFLTVHANRDERMPGGILWSPVAPVQVKGKWHCGRVDHAFSELVLLRL